jgi:septum site-determining protein MinC
MAVDLSLSKTAFEFKSASLTVPVMLLTSNDLLRIEEQLAERVSRASDFFRHSPVLIDLQQLVKRQLPLRIEDIVSVVRQQGLLPIGIRGGDEQQQQQAVTLALPVHGLASTQSTAAPARAAVEASKVSLSAQAAEAAAENRLISQPVRSGQRVYARGDLIVTATVSAGAEIMAEGNIHVYGSLRGRALAGVLGDSNSRIFCMDLQAELISIAGIYQLRDDSSEKHDAQRPVQISLEDQALTIKHL